MSASRTNGQEPEPTLGLTDVVLIELMKSDQNFSEFHANVDMNVCSEVKRKYRKDSKLWLARLVAERATEYCEKKLAWDTEALRSKLKSWLYRCVFTAIGTLFVVFFFHEIGTTQWLFTSNNNEVNIEKLMSLVIIPPLLCTLPFVACVALLFRRSNGGSDQRKSLLSKIARQFSIPGLIEGGWHVWQDFRGSKRSMVQDSLERFAKKRGHVGTILFVTLSNALVLLVSIAIFFAVLQFLLFNEVNYSWKSSLLKTTTKVNVVKEFGRLIPFVESPSHGAIEWAFGGEPPRSEVITDSKTSSESLQSPTKSDTTTAAAEATTEDRSEKPNVSIQAKSPEASEGDPPKAAQMVISRTGTPNGPLTVRYEIRGSAKSRDYAEDLNGEIVIPKGEASTTITITPVDNTAIDGTRTVELNLLPDRNYVVDANKSATLTIADDDSLEAYRSEWSVFMLSTMFALGILPRLVIGFLSAWLVRRSWLELKPNGDDDEIKKVVDNVMGDKVDSDVITTVPELKPKHEPEVLPNKTGQSSSSRHRPNRSVLVAYSLAEKDISALTNHSVSQKYELECVDGAAARHSWIDHLRSKMDIDRVILVVRATTVPDRAFSSFIAQVTDHLTARNGRSAMVMVGAREHLERVGGEARLNRDRLDLWKREAVCCGMDEAEVLALDLESADGKSHLEALLADSAISNVNGRIKLAGKYDKVLSHVEKKLNSACLSETVSSSQDWESVCKQIRQQITKIYEGEYQSFLSSITDTQWQERAAQIAPDFGLSNVARDVLARVLATQKFWKSLSPRWMIAGAVAGVGASAALPLLVGGTAGLPLLLGLLPYTTIGGGLTAQGILAFREAPSEGSGHNDDLPAYEGINLDVATRASLLLVVMLEFQNNSHDVIAAKVEQHLGALAGSAITTQQQMSATIAALRRSLSASSKESK